MFDSLTLFLLSDVGFRNGKLHTAALVFVFYCINLNNGHNYVFIKYNSNN